MKKILKNIKEMYYNSIMLPIYVIFIGIILLASVAIYNKSTEKSCKINYNIERSTRNFYHCLYIVHWEPTLKIQMGNIKARHYMHCARINRSQSLERICEE